MITEAGWPGERDRLRATGRLAGIGYSCFSERTGYGTPTMSQRRMRMTPGYDTAAVRMDPSGGVIVTTGTCGHGQGHETTFAQIVADRLGVHPAQVRLRQGDTDLASYGWGTWGSRSIVIGGGAARRAADGVATQLRQVAAHLLEASPADIELRDGLAAVRGDESAAVPVSELARIVHFQAHRLPEGLRYGLEARESFDPPGTFSNACHAALVAIDPGTGEIRLRRYLVVEDCGVVINPVIVDGQVRGGVTQGVAAALLEQVRYEPGRAAGQRHPDGLPRPDGRGDLPHRDRPPGDAVRVQRDRGQGHGRGRHHRRPGRGAQRGQRRAGRGGLAGLHRAHPGAALGHLRRDPGREHRMKDLHLIRLRVNGREHELAVESRRTLADMLRHDLGYTGTHLGCEHGICGACTVLVDGVPARACLMFGVQADGQEVATVEGLADGEDLSDLQQAFSDRHGLQCGFCTPGFLMLAEGYLAEQEAQGADAAELSEQQIREVVAANLCRCTGYQGIVEAVLETARRRRTAERP